MPLVSLENISKHYRIADHPVGVLFDINLTIERGEFLAIMGASGSGKSTLLNIIACLDDYTDGRYRFDGRDVQSLDKDAVADLRGRAMGFVFQHFHLIPSMTAQRNVELPLLYRGLPRHERQARAARLLDEVGLDDRREHLPTELSGGQQQRVAIARALANDPVLLIADEPTGSLDSQTGQEILTLFKTLHAEGKSVAMVTHDHTVAAAAERTIVLSDGRLQEAQP